MKKILLFTQFILLLSMPLIISSCGDDEGEGPVELLPELDGVYIYGSNTVASTAVEPKARMALAILNPAKSGGHETYPGYYGKLIYIGANSTIKISEVNGDESFTYGTDGGGTVTNGTALEYTDIDADFIHGPLLPDADPIEVSEEGLYYVFVNTVDDNFRMVKVKANMIGLATEDDYSASTPLTQIHASVDSTVFEATGLPLEGGDTAYKIRFNEGYEVYNNSDTIATLTFLGVEDYGVAWDSGINDLGYWDVNIPQKETGIFTYRLKFNAATGEWSEKKSRDYSTTEIGLFGNAYFKSEDVQGDWTDPYDVHGPTKEGNVYSWSWNNVELIEGGEFVILENGTWGGMAVLYDEATARAGDAFAEQITNNGESANFIVSAGGFYNITLEINIDSGVRTLTINSVE